MILKEIYHKEFMRRKVDEQYLQKYENVIVLGERFIEYYYVLIFQAQDNNKLAFYLLIENIKKPYLAKAKHYSNKDGYYTANKTIFNNKRLKSKLHNNGLHAKKKNKENDYPTSFLIHRLVSCLYQNIFDYEIHHINKANQQNNVCNLVKLRQKRHRWVESLPINIGIAISLRMQRRQKRKMFKVKRQTLAQNERLILEILKKENNNEKKEKQKNMQKQRIRN